MANKGKGLTKLSFGKTGKKKYFQAIISVVHWALVNLQHLLCYNQFIYISFIQLTIHMIQETNALWLYIAWDDLLPSLISIKVTWHAAPDGQPSTQWTWIQCALWWCNLPTFKLDCLSLRTDTCVCACANNSYPQFVLPQVDIYSLVLKTLHNMSAIHMVRHMQI